MQQKAYMRVLRMYIEFIEKDLKQLQVFGLAINMVIGKTTTYSGNLGSIYTQNI